MTTTQAVIEPLAHRVADELKQKILQGGYRQGQKFTTESEVAQQFGVSRTVAREAVNQLKALGIVSHHRHSRLRIARTDPVDLLSNSLPFYVQSAEDFGHLAQMRYVLELGAVDMVVANATDPQIETLANLAKEFEQAINSFADDDRQDEVELAFHGLILQMTHNPLIEGMHSVLENFFHSASDVLHHWQAQAGHDRCQNIWEHHAITHAIGQRDAESLRAHLRMHLKKLLIATES